MIGDGSPKRKIDRAIPFLRLGTGCLLLATCLFFIFQSLASDSLNVLIEKQSGFSLTPQVQESQRSALRSRLGLNQSLGKQLGSFYHQLVTGQMGVSLWTGQSVGKLIVKQAGITSLLALGSLLFFILVGTVWGFLQALLGPSSSAPGFFLKSLNTLFLCFPGFALASALFRFTHSISPEFLALIIYTAVTSPTLASLVRDRLLEEESKTYAQAAKARGLSRFLLLRKHLLAPCVPTLLSLIPWWWSAYVGTSIVIEPLFRISGLGLLAFEAFRNQDPNVLLGISLCFGWVRLLLGSIRDLFFLRFSSSGRGTVS